MEDVKRNSKVSNVVRIYGCPYCLTSFRESQYNTERGDCVDCHVVRFATHDEMTGCNCEVCRNGLASEEAQ